MEATVQVREVKAVQTRSGNTRYVLVDEKGNEYTTFRPEIGKRAQGAEGKQARIEFHEQERDVVPQRVPGCRSASRGCGG